MALSPWFRSFINYDPAPALKKVKCPVLAMNGRGDDRRGETGQSSDLNDAPRRENTDQGREKKVIARTNSSRIPDIIQIHHRMEKREFARRRNFADAPQERREGRIFCLKFLERTKFTDIEALARGARQRARESAPQFPHDFETATGRRIPKGIEITRRRRFQMRLSIVDTRRDET